MKPKVLTAALLVLSAGATAARASQAIVRPAEGPEARGQLQGVTGKILRIQSATGPRDFKLADLMAVEFPEAKAPDAAGCARVYTVAGDVIPAKVEPAAGKLVASGPWTDRFEVDTRNLAGILTSAGFKDEKARAELAMRGRRKDKLVLVNDDFEGTFEGFTKDGLKFKSFLGSEVYKLEQVLALAFTELKSVEPPGTTYYTAELAGGGRVSGAPMGLEGEKLRWKTLGGMELSLAFPAVSALRVRNGKVAFLSDLTPEKVEQKPFIQGLPFVWNWRRDTDVFGKPLKLGGAEFPRGLGVAAFTKLTYRLDGKFRRFRASVGVCDSAAPGGGTMFRVLVDGKERFVTEKPLARGGEPLKVDVKLGRAKVLDLVVDFGPDDSDLGDIGGWGEARLIK